MQGPLPTIADIEIQNLDSLLGVGEPDPPDVGSSSLSPDSLGEEEELELETIDVDPYRIKTTCFCCDTVLRFIIVTGDDSVKAFESLLLQDLSFLCPHCVASYVNLRNGKR
ncbi:E7 [Mus musculus papillomavirus type 1]|uniref:Protein E7 n=1 Tax=Mus musculus papillomavirus type 1 TaxID=763552 RepID=F8SIL7_9PAPI|nr:E7 [Mus musculus papillomavirus type 1]